MSGTASSADGDFTAASGTLTFTAGGPLSLSVQVTVNGDTTVESDETFTLQLSNIVSSAGAASISDSSATGAILNDDTAPPPAKPIIASGDVDQDSVVLWGKTYTVGGLTIELFSDPARTQLVSSYFDVVTDILQPEKVTIAGLSPNTTYYYKVTDAVGQVTNGGFSTPASLNASQAGAQSHDGLTFGVSGDWRGETAPYPALQNADTEGLKFFVALGDTIYADYPSPDVPAAQASTLAEYRAKHSEVYSEHAGSNTLSDLRATTPVLAVIDDHEVINDFSGGAPASSDPRFNTATGLVNETALYQNGLQAFTEYNPIESKTYAGTGDARFDGKPNLFREIGHGQDAVAILVDSRSFRDTELSPVTDLTNSAQITNFLVQSFDSTRTLLGSVQLAELKQSLLDAQIEGRTWKFVFLPEPIQNLGVLEAQDRYEGYAAERTALLKFINDNGIKNVVFISADIHGTVTNNLTYQEFPGGPQIATSAWEITTGSVAFDAPFGQTVFQLASAAGLISAQNQAFYNSLPVAPDTDSVPNDKDDFIESVVNQQVTALGYDPVGLDSNLSQAAGKIDATLLSGDYLITHNYGWTKFAIDAATQELRVTTYGTPYYSAADAASNPAAVAAQTVSVMGEFTVRPETGSGSDTLAGTSGNDTVDGGFGNDTISAGDGADAVYGGYGNDSIDGGTGIDSIFAGVGDDTVRGGDGADGIAGEQGNDTIFGEAGNDYILGGDGEDTIDGGADDDAIFGAAGFDTLSGGAGKDSIDGGAGIDLIHGDDGDDYIVGGADGDNVFGDGGNDAVFGGAGIDVVRGGDGDDSLDGGDDTDYLHGDAGVDWLFGQAGNDSLLGGGEGDVLFGGDGTDSLYGEAGNDRLDGGAGGDILTGGTGADIFSFATGWGDDRIEDFEDGIDKIDIVDPALTSFSQLTITQVGADTLVTYAGNSITLVNTQATNLTQADFLANGTLLA